MANDFNVTTGLWVDTIAASCYTAAETALTGCRGGTAIEIDGEPGTLWSFSFPSFALAGGVTKSGTIKATAMIPTGQAIQPLAKTPETVSVVGMRDSDVGGQRLAQLLD